MACRWEFAAPSSTDRPNSQDPSKPAHCAAPSAYACIHANIQPPPFTQGSCGGPAACRWEWSKLSCGHRFYEVAPNLQCDASVQLTLRYTMQRCSDATALSNQTRELSNETRAHSNHTRALPHPGACRPAAAAGGSLGRSAPTGASRNRCELPSSPCGEARVERCGLPCCRVAFVLREDYEAGLRQGGREAGLPPYADAWSGYSAHTTHQRTRVPLTAAL